MHYTCVCVILIEWHCEQAICLLRAFHFWKILVTYIKAGHFHCGLLNDDRNNNISVKEEDEGSGLKNDDYNVVHW